MAVSSLKGCWSKLSARIRDYIDVVDSYYRPADEVDGHHSHQHPHHHHHRANRNANGEGIVDFSNHACSRKDCIMSSLIDLGSTNNDAHKDRRHAIKKLAQRSSHNYPHNHQSHNQNQHDHNYITVDLSVDLRAPRLTEQQNKHAPTLSPRKQNSLSTGSYTKRKTAQGQIYFVDIHGHRYWHDPSVPKELLTASLDLDSLVGRLSNNWEVKQTNSGRTYYINHTKRTTQFTDPRLVAYKDQLVNYLRGACYEISTNPNDPCGSNEHSTDSLPSCPVNASSRYHESSITHGATNYAAYLQRQQQPTSQTSGRASQQNSHSNLNSKRRNQCSITNISTAQHNDNLLGGTLENRSSKQYNRNLMRGSHNNLHTASTAGQSNTFTGPIPTWIKPLVLNGPRKQTTRPSGGGNSSTRQQDTTPSRNSQNSSCVETQVYDISSNNSSHDRSHASPLGSRIPLDTSYHSQKSDSNVNKELCEKISFLRQELLKQQILSHPCRVDINRKRIFEESFRAISQMQPRDLKKRLLVKFKGEEGLDYGGVAREWFYLLSREILNPVHGLFQYTSDDIYNLQINPDSGIVYREHLSYMNFCGRIIGMAVFHGHFIEGHFTLPFYKMLLRKPINLNDIENVDPELHRSLCWILENDITEVIDTTFLVQHNAFGQLQEHELKENGRNIVVTESNKHEYVSLYVNYRCRRGIESQFEALQRGFYELVSPNLVENFDERELELLIGGLSKINIDDWRLHTKLKNCTVETPLVIWFWDIVKSYDEDKRARLLQFVTGSPRVPIQGFKALQGVNSELRLFTIHLIKNTNTDNLPKSHTCFNRIDLPPYETYDKLRDKLTQAIEETMGFAMQ